MLAGTPIEPGSVQTASTEKATRTDRTLHGAHASHAWRRACAAKPEATLTQLRSESGEPEDGREEDEAVDVALEHGRVGRWDPIAARRVGDRSGAATSRSRDAGGKETDGLRVADRPTYALVGLGRGEYGVALHAERDEALERPPDEEVERQDKQEQVARAEVRV